MRKLNSAKRTAIKLVGAHTDVVSRRERNVTVTATVTEPTAKSQTYTGWNGCFFKQSNRVVAVFVKRGSRCIEFGAAHGTCSA